MSIAEGDDSTPAIKTKTKGHKDEYSEYVGDLNWGYWGRDDGQWYWYNDDDWDDDDYEDDEYYDEEDEEEG